VAFGADGRLYVSSDGRVWQLTADGARVEHVAIPTAIGIARRGAGLVVAALGESIDADMIDGGVFSVAQDGAATQLTASIASPNFVAITPGGDALVSDDFDTRVFRVTQGGQVSEALSVVPSPNGIAYSPDGAALYVASTFTPDGQLTKYDVDADGLPIEASAREILQLGAASTPDGIAVDEDGMVYVAANIRGELWRVDGAAETVQPGELVAEQLGYPASLAFGDGAGFDRCSVYVTQLMEPVVWRVFIGVPGAPLYE
ncbi:MAG: SMP-30/gluconolactonase/LRE family protein, partial [Myxococcales bacterium]|nr:SMP-30/gluconolactonase/LRE family protein [Myxococcales bacterium]